MKQELPDHQLKTIHDLSQQQRLLLVSVFQKDHPCWCSETGKKKFTILRKYIFMHIHTCVSVCVCGWVGVEGYWQEWVGMGKYRWVWVGVSVHTLIYIKSIKAPSLTLNSCETSWEFISGIEVGAPITRNLSLTSAAGASCSLTVTLMSSWAPPSRTPTDGRTRYFSGEVVLIYFEREGRVQDKITFVVNFFAFHLILFLLKLWMGKNNNENLIILELSFMNLFENLF